jgi:hypothetical protein
MMETAYDKKTNEYIKRLLNDYPNLPHTVVEQTYKNTLEDIIAKGESENVHDSAYTVSYQKLEATEQLEKMKNATKPEK